MPIPHLDSTQWLMAAIAALCIGLSKAGFGGVAMISVLLMTMVLPARESTGAVLPMLILADIFAVIAYHRHADFRLVLRLMIPALIGVVCGWLLMPVIPDEVFARVIGWVTLVLILLLIVQKTRPRWMQLAGDHPGVAWPFGWMAGVTTMLANAAGPITTVYLLACRLPKMAFVGTGAWYFFVLNMAKVPFSASLGLINPSSLTLNLLLAPAVVIGMFSGKWLLGKVSQNAFEWLLIGFSLIGAARLALR